MWHPVWLYEFGLYEFGRHNLDLHSFDWPIAKQKFQRGVRLLLDGSLRHGGTSDR